jgi:hypothetical protein
MVVICVLICRMKRTWNYSRKEPKQKAGWLTVTIRHVLPKNVMTTLKEQT